MSSAAVCTIIRNRHYDNANNTRPIWSFANEMSERNCVCSFDPYTQRISSDTKQSRWRRCVWWKQRLALVDQTINSSANQSLSNNTTTCCGTAHKRRCFSQSPANRIKLHVCLNCCLHNSLKSVVQPFGWLSSMLSLALVQCMAMRT